MRDRLIKIVKESLIRHIDKTCKLAENITDDLLSEGVIVPPCRVRQTVYITLHPYTFLPLKKVVEGEVISIHKHEFGLFIRVLFDTKKINGCADYEKWTWGERLFFTREEAEKALDERSKK